MKKIWFIPVIILCLSSSMAFSKETPVTLSPEKKAEMDQLVKKGDSLLARKFYEDAILQYRKALDIDPKEAILQNKMGIAYHQLQNTAMAKKQYELAKKLNPKYSEAWNNLGTIYYGTKKYKKAIKCYEKSLELNPQSATAYHNMGAAYFGLKKYEKGFQAFQEAFRLDPTILDRTSNYGTVIKTTELNQAMQNFYLAKIFAVNGQQEKAIAYLLKALEMGFDEYDKITKEPAFKQLVQDERLTRAMEPKKAAN
jgi:tetratricopeptide (TPR) repeat protein